MSLIGSQEKILQRLESIISTPSDDDEVTKERISVIEACQCYTDLVASMEVATKVWRVVSSQPMSSQLQREFLLEADVYRALVGLSLFIHQFVPNNESKARLLKTYRQANLLLQILDQTYRLFLQPHEDLPTSCPAIYEWVYQQENQYQTQEGDTTDLITFDKEELAMEEEDLIQMASTPTPKESSNSHRNTGPSSHKSVSLEGYAVNTMALGDGASIKFVWNDRGYLQTDNHPGIWWALTAKSTATCDSTTCTITNLFTNHCLEGEQLKLSELSLSVKDTGSQWSDCITYFVHRLKDLQALQDQLDSYWPKDKVQVTCSRARAAMAS